MEGRPCFFKLSLGIIQKNGAHSGILDSKGPAGWSLPNTGGSAHLWAPGSSPPLAAKKPHSKDVQVQTAGSRHTWHR